MERLVAMMAFCEAPLDGTLVPSGAAGYAASATGGAGNVVALLDANEGLLRGAARRHLGIVVGAARYGASATGSASKVVALLDAAAKKWPMEKLVATMAFCEAPLDGTFDGTSALSSGAAGDSSASGTNVVPGEAGGGGDAAALRRAWLGDAKEWPLREHRLLRDKAGTVVDGPAIFETVALE